MSALTKTQLVAELAALRAHVALREAEWEATKAELAALRARVPALKVERPVYVRREPAPEWLLRRAALDKAREAAMMSGCVVKAVL